MGDKCRGKLAWPELLGTKGDDAVSVIENENPKVKHAFVFPAGRPRTEDYRCDRVRIMVDIKGIIVEVSTVG